MNTDSPVFLVDDDSFSTAICIEYLAGLGFTNIYCYGSGKELLDNLDKKPAVIFLDYYLGDYEAAGLLEKIQSRNPGVYVVILSGQPEMEVTIDMLKNGAFDYIVKNEFQLQKIGAVLGRLIAADDYSQKLKITGSDQDHHKTIKVIIEAQEKVRKELSGELHDNINQLIGAGKLYIDLYLKAVKQGNGNNVNMLHQSKSILETALTEIRKLSKNLNAGFIKNLRLKDALLSLIDSLQQQHSITVSAHIQLDELPTGLTPYIQHEAFRMVQELINNIIVHAAAKNIHIEAIAVQEMLQLKVMDDGVGSGKNEFIFGEGLTNIVKRINELQGIYTVKSTASGGCSWDIQLPLLHAAIIN
jgi:signal transduction histidine kinase